MSKNLAVFIVTNLISALVKDLHYLFCSGIDVFFRRMTVEEILHRLRPTAMLSDQVSTE